MSKKIKALGLALTALGALLAVSAFGMLGTAQGVENPTLTSTNNVYPNQLHGKSAGHIFTSGGSSITCTESTFAATIKGATNHVEVAPTYTGHCTAGSQPATVTVNGCKYTLHHLTTVPGTTHYSSTVDVVCPKGKVIEVHAYLGSGHLSTVCTITVPPQVNKGTITITNEANTEAIILEGAVEGITKEEHGSFCPGGNTVPSSNAIYHIAPTTVTGTQPVHVG